MKTANEVLNDIAFNGITSACDWIQYNADRIDVYAVELTRRDSFRTSMEAALDRAETTLSAALKSVREARKKYQGLEAA